MGNSSVDYLLVMYKLLMLHLLALQSGCWLTSQQGCCQLPQVGCWQKAQRGLLEHALDAEVGSVRLWTEGTFSLDSELSQLS